MGFEDLSRAQLLALLDDFLEQHDRRRRELTAQTEQQDRSIAELQLYQVELEIQNRELRSAHTELEEARDRYSELFELAPVAYLALDDAGIVIRANQVAALLFRSTVGRLCGSSLVALSGGSSQLAGLLGRSASDAARANACVPIQVDGQRLDVEMFISCTRDAQGRSIYRCALLDVTARVRAERERDRALASERAMHECFQTLDRIHVGVNKMLAAPHPTLIRSLVRLFSVPLLELFEARQVRIELDVLDGESELAVASRDDHESTVDLNAPVLVAGRSLGEIRVTFARSAPARHGQALVDYARTLELVADRLAMALELLRLQQAEASERRRLHWLDDARRKLNSASDLDEVTQAISSCCEDARAQLNVQSAAYLWDRGAPTLLFAPPRFEPVLSRWLVVSDANTRQTYDAVSAPRLRPLLHVLGRTSLMLVPMRARERTLGQLCFALPAGDRPELERTLDEFAFMAASALDTAQLLHELRGAVSARDTLLALVAHDLRSPLNAISLTASSLSEPPPHKERRNSAPQFQLIQRSIQRMSHLIEDLLTAANIESGSFAVERRALPAIDLALEACALNLPMAESKHISLTAHCPEGLDSVWADRERVLQVLTNLIVNALKFSKAGSRVEISCEAHGSSYRYCVRDYGTGMSPEQTTQVFRRYWRAKNSRGGLGLGLFIAERIVSAHQGRIWVESSLGNGCAFYFTLPGAAQRTALASAPQNQLVR